jgi:hypothetical protein
MESLGVGTRVAKAKLQIAREEAKKRIGVERVKKAKRARQSFKGTHVLPHKELLPIFNFTPMDLVDGGFDEKTLEDHQIGYDRRHERVTFPIWDVDGNLVGISGRKGAESVGPKYKVYQGWHENADGVRVPGELGEWYPTYSSEGIRDHLWRGERVYNKIYQGLDEGLIIVEGYKAALWLAQLGWDTVVAIMGSTMTAQQERLIFRMGTPTWVFLDANYAGRRGSRDICWRLGNASFPVLECTYDSVEFDDPEGDVSALRDDLQPDDLSEAEIDTILASAKRKTRKLKHDKQRSRKARSKKTSKKKLPRARGR